MDDPPQPSNSPYSPGDTVKVYLDPRDPDSEFHGIKGRITDVHTDNLDNETDRELDAYSYSIEDCLTGKQLPVHFRHFDLIPAN